MTVIVYAAPVLKYSGAGTFGNWTEEAYYCSPVIIDLDGDGSLEIVCSAYSIYVLDAATGSLKWRVNSGHDRSEPFVEIGGNNGFTWSDLEVCDIDGDGEYEIISCHGGGCISVLDKDGYFKAGWPGYPTDKSLRSLNVCDLDLDGKSEIIVGAGVESPQSVWVYSYDGKIREGWPQLSTEQSAESNPSDYKNNGWGYGIFSDGIETGDINNDGYPEILVPTDMGFMAAYTKDGKLIKANSELYGGRTWAKIPFYENQFAELRMDNEGWGMPIEGDEKREELYRAELGHAGTAIKDVDNDGNNEIIVSGIMANRKYKVFPPTEYMTIFILNGDRSRYYNEELGFDWRKIPTDLGEPLVQNEETVSSMVEADPVVIDLDNDGYSEILFPSYNGKLHCFSLDGTEHGAWPFSLTKRSSPLYEYASSPAVKDMNSDGFNEIIFTSWFDSGQSFGTRVNGSLYILDHKGKLLSKTPLPDSTEKIQNNGAMAAPAVTDIDGDGKYEAVINTLYSGICVYDIN